MEDHKKEKNISLQDPNQKEEINPNKSIEIPQSNKSLEKIEQKKKKKAKKI